MAAGAGLSSFGQGLSGGATLFSAISTYQESKRQASGLREQASTTLFEAYRDASITRQETRDFMAKQSLQFIGSGVELTGSALITIAQTGKYGETEARATESKGRAEASRLMEAAASTERQGRAALISGVLNTAAMFA